MSCCNQDCEQGRSCPSRSTRRVRAGGPPPAEADEYAGLPIQMIDTRWDRMREFAAWAWTVFIALCGVGIVVTLARALALWGLI